MGVAVNAAQSIRLERERETFDSLLTTPLSSEDILYGKWLGAILSVRRMLPWLGFIWGLGVLGGGLNPLAVPLLVLTWCVYAAAMASLGLWFSLVSQHVAAGRAVHDPRRPGVVGRPLAHLAAVRLSHPSWRGIRVAVSGARAASRRRPSSGCTSPSATTKG